MSELMHRQFKLEYGQDDGWYVGRLNEVPSGSGIEYSRRKPAAVIWIGSFETLDAS